MAVYDTLRPKIYPPEGPADLYVGSGRKSNGNWPKSLDNIAKQPSDAGAEGTKE